MIRARALVPLALLVSIAACSRQTAEPPKSQPESAEPPEPDAPPPALDPFTPYHDWKLVELGERSDVPDGKNGKVLTLLFDSSTGRASGFSGCNQFTGGFTVDGKKLRFGELAGTRMACPPAQMELEGAYLAALAAADRFKLIGAELQLLGPTHDTEMRFRPIEIPKP